jgi:hypothetical protein
MGLLRLNDTSYLERLSTGASKMALCLLLFTITVAVRAPLVDRDYHYSYEADSTPCIEHTRSFYFFFKKPCSENLPHTLSSYPTYLDGDYITTALVATICAPMAKAGILPAELSDSDDSLIIFSMRWSGVLMDAASVVLLFLILILLLENTFLSFSLCLLYYIVNSQTLHVDLIRVDHYTLLAAMAVMWATVSLFLSPGSKRYYILFGLAIGMVSGTKLNFPFYLAPTGLVMLTLLYQRKIKWSHMALFVIATLLSACFIFQRWLMYPEEVRQTVQEILQTGEEWFLFWGNKNYFYYLWGQFFDHGYSLSVLLFLIAFYGAFIYCAVDAIRSRKQLHVILSLAFVLQIIALMLSPKVARYGIIIPVWACIFIGIGLKTVLERYGRIAAGVSIAIVLAPLFI